MGPSRNREAQFSSRSIPSLQRLRLYLSDSIFLAIRATTVPTRSRKRRCPGTHEQLRWKAEFGALAWCRRAGSSSSSTPSALATSPAGAPPVGLEVRDDSNHSQDTRRRAATAARDAPPARHRHRGCLALCFASISTSRIYVRGRVAAPDSGRSPRAAAALTHLPAVYRPRRAPRRAGGDCRPTARR